MSLPAPAPGSVVVVTGASSGIGAELARSLAALGHDLVLVARREDRLQQLAEELRREHGRDVLVHAADLTDQAAREGLIGFVAGTGRTITGLCNNAGYGLAGLAWERDLAQSRDTIELNVVALHDLTLLVVPDMIRAGTGAVLNVASVAAYQPLPGMAAYAATKAFVHAFSEALHEELAGTGVSVTTLYPGPVPTEFGDNAGLDLEGGSPGIMIVQPGEVARQAVAAMVAGRRSVNPGTVNRVTGLLGRYSPRSVLLPVMKRQLRSRTGS